jgi:FPC/CPF motif-containing protein YcgG/ectoine hydroxylase-related dioxygenase (phytanoyl-CoA dioxygenase family)
MKRRDIGQDRQSSALQSATERSLIPPSGMPYWTSKEIDDFGQGRLPFWAPESLAAFRQAILSPDFPCMFATSSEQQDRLVYSFIDTATNGSDIDSVVKAICKFLECIATLPQQEADLSVLIVFIKPKPGMQLSEYGAMTQAFLQSLHERDTAPWPPDIPIDEDDPRWSFAFAGRALFINVSTPANLARLSRNLGPSMTLVISPLDVFGRIAGPDARGRRIRSSIRARTQDYDRGLPFAPWTSIPYGESSVGTERSQYILPDNNDEPISISIMQCPLQSESQIGRPLSKEHSMISAEQRVHFEKEGYVVVPEILSREVVAGLKLASEELGAAEPGRRSWNERSCFRRTQFARILEANPLTTLAAELIGEDVQLLQLDLLRTRSGDPEPEWHRDVDFVCNKTIAISVAIYFQDSEKGNGPLRIVPATHRLESGPATDSGDLPGQILLPAGTATAIVHDSALWHAATLDGSDIDCWALFPIFGKYWIKRRDAGCRQPPPERIRSLMDPLQRQLLGFDLRPGIQTYLGSDEQYNRRGDAGIDFA